MYVLFFEGVMDPIKKYIKIEWEEWLKYDEPCYNLKITEQSHRWREFGDPRYDNNRTFRDSKGFRLTSSFTTQASTNLLYVRGQFPSDDHRSSTGEITKKYLLQVINAVNEYNGHFGSPEIQYTIDGPVPEKIELPKELFEI